jgi:hypothetical protein
VAREIHTRAPDGSLQFPEWPGSATLIERNRFISDWTQAPGPYNSRLTLLSARGEGRITLKENVLVWPDPATGTYQWSGGPRLYDEQAAELASDAGTVIHRGRAAAGLPAYPALPPATMKR